MTTNVFYGQVEDPRIDLVLSLLRDIREDIQTMSETVRSEIAMLQTNMTNLHAAVANIQARLAAAISAAGNGDPTAVADLQAINDDLVAVVASAGPPPAPEPPPLPVA